MKNLISSAFILLILTSCSVSKNIPNTFAWTDIAVIEELEVYTDTSRIEHKEDRNTHAWIKTVYMTQSAKDTYVRKIKDSFKLSESELDKRMKKWDNFTYNVSYRIYDCTNKRYKVMEVTDYSSDGKPIITTKAPKGKEKWQNVGIDTMGDHTLYFICDYGN